MRRTVCAVFVATSAIPRVALACPVCFGAGEGAMLQGSNMGILALLVVTLAMLGAFAAFFGTLARRAARFAEQSSTDPIIHRAPSAGGSVR
ncbi:MAG: hypothetical protein AB7H96_16330 [Vicinamibacterales bacterium]